MNRLHHIDIHVSALAETEKLFDALMPAMGWRKVDEEDSFLAFIPSNSDRPKIRFDATGPYGGGTMQLAFEAASREDVDRLGQIVRDYGGGDIEGPELCAEYGPTYYAVFFKDPEGNRFEICFQ